MSAETGKIHAIKPAVATQAVRIPLRAADRRLLLFAGDLLAAFLALFLAAALWIGFRPDIRLTLTFFETYWVWFTGLAAFWIALLFMAGGYSLRDAGSKSTILLRLVAITFVAFVVYLTFFFLASPQPRSLYDAPLDFPLLRVLPIAFILIVLPLEVMWRMTYATYLTGDQFRIRLLVAGTGRASAAFVNALDAQTTVSNYEIVGLIAEDSPVREGVKRDSAARAATIVEHPVLGGPEAIRSFANSGQIDEIVVATEGDLEGDLFEAVFTCFERGIRISPMAVVYETVTGRIPVEHVGAQWYVTMSAGAVPPSRFYLLMRRFVDIVASLVGMVVLGLAIPFVLIGNAIGSRGPLFYWQQRVGRDGVAYGIIKFRSMIPQAEEGTGAVWARQNDPRITAFGSFLRKSRLDELPQFWNVLKGEMSLIGPRPERPEFVEELAVTIPFYRSRHAVKPGLTGWAQVKYRYGASVEDALTKLTYDLYYIKHQGFALDLLILYKTVRVVLGLQGR